MEDYIVYEVKPKSRWKRFKEKAKEKKDRAVEWCKNHPEPAIVILTGTASCVVKIVGSTVKHHRKVSVQKKDEELREEYCYDRSLGHYWKLRRKLTNEEWREIERRKAEGEKLGDILEQLKLLE